MTDIFATSPCPAPSKTAKQSGLVRIQTFEIKESVGDDYGEVGFHKKYEQKKPPIYKKIGG